DAQLQSMEEEATELQAKLASNAFDPEALGRLSSARQLLADLEQVEKERKVAEETLTRWAQQSLELGQAAEQAEELRSTAESRSQVAATAVQEAERHDLAAALRHGLQPGDACPVCGGVVGELPELMAGDLKLAQQQRAQAAAKLAEASKAAQA